MLIGDTLGKQRQLDDVTRLPFMRSVVNDGLTLAFNNVMNHTSLAMLFAALASWWNFLYRKNKRLVTASLHGGVEIPLHDALGIGFPEKLRAANDERAFRAERALPVSKRDQLRVDGRFGFCRHI